MVSIKEINENLNKLKNNPDKIVYLEKILKEINDKKLSDDIKKLIQDLRELEEVMQIETRKKVEWSLPEEIPEERRTLERQVASAPIIREEKKDDMKINYGLQNNVDFYRGEKLKNSENGYRSSNTMMNERKPFIEQNESLIERRVNEQFTGSFSHEHDDEPMRYQSNVDNSRGYSSLSEELHEKERKKNKAF